MRYSCGLDKSQRAEPLISAKAVEEITEGALDILENIGIRIAGERFAAAVWGNPLTMPSRLCIPRAQARSFLEECAAFHRSRTETCTVVSDGRLCGHVNDYCSGYLMPGTEKIQKYHTSALEQMTRFVQNLSLESDICPGAAGYPSDVPSALESLARLKIGAQCASGGWSAEPTTLYAAKYIFEMVKVLDIRVPKLTVYVSSPLTVGGESADIALEFGNRVSYLKVTSMPLLGATTPLSIPAALALSLAEVLGGGWAVHQATGLPVELKPQLHAFDFHSLNMVFGVPESLLTSRAANSFSAALFGGPPDWRSANAHTSAKRPGIQSAAEKSMVIHMAAMKGARDVSGMGALSLDEIFSPVQLVLDAELLEQAYRLRCGFPEEDMPPDLLELVRGGLNSGFVGTDLTLDRHRDFMRYSDLFEHDTLAAFNNKGAKDALERAEDKARRLLKAPVSYELPREQSEQLDRIYIFAWNHLS